MKNIWILMDDYQIMKILFSSIFVVISRVAFFTFTNKNLIQLQVIFSELQMSSFHQDSLSAVQTFVFHSFVNATSICKVPGFDHSSCRGPLYKPMWGVSSCLMSCSSWRELHHFDLSFSMEGRTQNNSTYSNMPGGGLEGCPIPNVT